MSIDTNEMTPMFAWNFTSGGSSSSSSDDTDNQLSFVDQKIGAFVVIIASVITFMTLGAMALRNYYWKKYGVDIFAQSGHGSRRQQLESDRALAEELQRRVNDEEREKERIMKRNDRRDWYEQYIKDFTMVRTVGVMAVILSRAWQ